MKISFDFDQTLTDPKIQELSKKFIAAKHEVWITTSRSIRAERTEILNSDLFKLAESLGISKKNIQFTNYEEKYNYLSQFDLHFDNDEHEVLLINAFPINCVGVLVNVDKKSRELL